MRVIIVIVFIQKTYNYCNTVTNVCTGSTEDKQNVNFSIHFVVGNVIQLFV